MTDLSRYLSGGRGGGCNGRTKNEEGLEKAPCFKEIK